jgi:hypothetical protein
MAEFINPTPQTITAGNNVQFTDTPVEPCPCVRHREGSGIFTLRGGHKYLVAFSANIAGAAATTEVELSFTLGGEALTGTRMVATSTAAGDLYHVTTFAEIAVPCGCCYTLAVENTGTAAVDVEDANLLMFKED